MGNPKVRGVYLTIEPGPKVAEDVLAQRVQVLSNFRHMYSSHSSHRLRLVGSGSSAPVRWLSSGAVGAHECG